MRNNSYIATPFGMARYASRHFNIALIYEQRKSIRHKNNSLDRPLAEC